MRIENTPIEGLKVIHPDVFADPRGYFYESWNEKTFAANGITTKFVQDNQSLSQKNVLRGLHLQAPPFAQAKLVRVISGAVLDIAVDIRRNSPTYGKHFSIELSEENKLMFFLPEGFAHGFLTLRDHTVFAYKCSNYYDRNSEMTIRWDDPALGIKWNVKDPVLSEKDRIGTPIAQFNSPF